MKKVLCRSLVLALGVTFVASAAFAKNVNRGLANYDRNQASSINGDVMDPQSLASSAAQGTTYLYSASFDVGASCTAAGWTTADMTAQSATYFHVDDFVTGGALAGYAAIQGSKSLWCGARPANTAALCGYVALPGYGNGWNQAWCSKVCLATTGGNIGVSFKADFDSEPGYDATTLEYTADCTGASGWTELDGGIGVWDGNFATTVAGSYGGGALPASVRIRLHFTADGAWSDQDGLWPTNGAVIIDSLKAGALAVEDFEGEAVNATSSNDWQACTPAGYGQYMALFPGVGQVQQDPCARDLSCVWAAINLSLETYACGGFPAQKAVPKGNAAGQYLENEVWSPNIPLAGSGAVVQLQFSIYRDMPLDNLVFYTWHVRTVVAGCPSSWINQNFVHYGGQKDWFRHTQAVGGFLNLAGGSDMNVSIGIVDMCGVWCGVFGSGACHSHAPLLDSVRVVRVNNVGPQWTIRDIDQFHDNWSTDGTITGTARADMSNDVLPGTNPGILPGDSAVVQSLADPVSGLANDLSLGGKKAYIWVAVQPFGQVGKSGSALSDDLVRFPYAGSQVQGGITWDKFRLDQAILNGNPVANTFCVDLNDNLFTPGDTVLFFYSAENTNGVVTYAYGSTLGASGSSLSEAAANASEFTIFPAGGYNRGGDILYVDGMDGRGAQPFFDTAFQSLVILDKVDRYDVRGPSSGVNNRLDGRVTNVLTQLVGVYQKILWDSGDLSVTLGDGSGTPEKTDDYGLVNTFLDNLEVEGGVYLCGDDIFSELALYASASAVTFRTTYLTHTLTAADHVPSFGISPVGKGTAGNAFNADTFIIFGGCPLINDFDVAAPTGSSVMEVSYGNVAATNGAVLSKVTSNSNNVDVKAMVSGFAFEYIRDDENDGIMDRADHMYDIITYLENVVPAPTGAGPVAKNTLSQNYPNPFNPQTTIAFSVKDRGLVSLKVYNVAGQLVRTLANEDVAAGSYTKVWDGRNDAGQTVSSGVYFYKLVTNSFSQTKKMVLLK